MSASVRVATVPGLEAIGGLVHGFEQRLGPDGWEERDEARRRVAEAVAPSGRLHLLKQVHGAAVVRAPWDGRPESDAAVAPRAGVLLGIETADCLPVFVADPVRRVVAAAHAGWRGTAQRVTAHAVESLVADGSRATDLVAALGPCIGPCCYEVGAEVVEAMGPQAERFFHSGPRGRAHVDLRAANRAQLEQAGVAPERIGAVADCTFCRADLYHSYRRSGKGAGRMINFVGFAG